VTDDDGATGADFVTITVSAPPTDRRGPDEPRSEPLREDGDAPLDRQRVQRGRFYVERGVKPKKGATVFTRVATLGPNATTTTQSPGSARGSTGSRRSARHRLRLTPTVSVRVR